MLLNEGETAPLRRRGVALERALLEAAWLELSDNGYAGFTIEGVATRARTSTPVLYRRWPNRRDLAIAALQFTTDAHPMIVPDTGNLRSDLIAYLRIGATERGEVTVLFSMRMAEFFTELEVSPADARQKFPGGQESSLDEVYERAERRGEIKPGTLTPRRRLLPMDVLRNELIMSRRSISDEVIEEMVDEILLPVLAPQLLERS